jgi:hypothetical protein
VIKLCEIWANIYPIFNLVIKTSESRGSSAPATIPSASRSKTTRRTRAGRRRDGWYCARGLPQVEVKLRPQIPSTDLKVLGFNIGAQVARGSTLPAGWVFLAGDSACIINPPTNRWDRRQHRSPGRPHNVAWKLWQRCSTARLVPRSTRYTYHTMNGT